MKFFQRFQVGLLADVTSSLVWTLEGDQQCASKLPAKCGPLCDARVEEKEVQISLIVRHESERALLFGLIIASFLFGCSFGSRRVDRIRRRGVVA